MLRRIFAGVGLILFLGALGLGAAYVFRFELLRWREGLPAFSHAPGAITTERVAMRDGVGLATSVFLPAGGERFPGVLIRNPYQRFDRIVKDLWCGVLVRYGFACIYQDVRGVMASEGDWDPMVHDRADGIDTLAWLVAQPFQDGNLALYGPSYLGAVQWAVADSLPPEVKTIIPIVISTDFRRAVFENGMFRHETFTAWAAMMRDGTMHVGAGDDYQAALRHRPHAEADERFFGGALPWYREWIASPAAAAPIWQREDFRALRAAPGRVRIPVLMIGGWYDVFFGPQVDDFLALGSRDRSKFLIGPWTHGGTNPGVLDFPGTGGGLNQWRRVLDWLGHHLRGEPLDQTPSGVESYAIGPNRWIERSTWPPPTRAQRLHLIPGGETDGCAVGRLAATPPTSAGSSRYRYDPLDPTPTRGGSGMLAFLMPGFDGQAAANQWQREPCERPDVLSFLSEPLTDPLAMVGAPRVGLRVSSDAPDTAFHAKLVEVFADGRAVNVRDGITSLAFRDGEDDAPPLVRGAPVDLAIALWPIEWTFRAGSRLRLDVASADFPKFHAHPNRREAWAQVREPQPANQTVHTGPDAPSWLELPILEPGP